MRTRKGIVARRDWRWIGLMSPDHGVVRIMPSPHTPYGIRPRSGGQLLGPKWLALGRLGRWTLHSVHAARDLSFSGTLFGRGILMTLALPWPSAGSCTAPPPRSSLSPMLWPHWLTWLFTNAKFVPFTELLHNPHIWSFGDEVFSSSMCSHSSGKEVSVSNDGKRQQCLQEQQQRSGRCRDSSRKGRMATAWGGKS